MPLAMLLANGVNREGEWEEGMPEWAVMMFICFFVFVVFMVWFGIVCFGSGGVDPAQEENEYAMCV